MDARPTPVTARRAADWLTPRNSNAHKGDAGRVYILAGSRGMAGAAVLSSIGAVRSGAGLVRVGIVASQQPVVARRAPLEVTSDALPEDRDGHLSSAAWPAVRRALDAFQADVIAVGPGLGRSRAIERIVRGLMFEQECPVVLDADGLNALAAMSPRREVRAPAIFTPHPGEMARLLGTRTSTVAENRLGAVVAAARRYGAVALLKGEGTLVTDGRSVFRNTTGNAAMATGGMGDVLTGVVAATWAQMPEATRASGAQAAALAAFVHGLAADIAVKRFPERSLIASDLGDTLPDAFQFLWRQRRSGRPRRRSSIHRQGG
jgi:NAD(P)H-hydrate epimerase